VATHSGRAKGGIERLHGNRATAGLYPRRALQAALLTHDATLLWWMPTPTTSLTSRLYPSLTPRHHGDHLATVLDPVSAAVNLLAGYFELPIGDLIKLSSTDLQLDDIDTTQHAQKPSPALMLGNQRLFLPRWTMPVLRTYLCLRDHVARSRAPGSPELFQRDGTGLDWHQAWNAQRDAGYRNTYGYVEAPYSGAGATRSIETGWMNNRSLHLYPLTTRPHRKNPASAGPV
jgi:hypothetical protein